MSHTTPTASSRCSRTHNTNIVSFTISLCLSQARTYLLGTNSFHLSLDFVSININCIISTDQSSFVLLAVSSPKPKQPNIERHAEWIHKRLPFLLFDYCSSFIKIDFQVLFAKHQQNLRRLQKARLTKQTSECSGLENPLHSQPPPVPSIEVVVTPVSFGVRCLVGQ